MSRTLSQTHRRKLRFGALFGGLLAALLVCNPAVAWRGGGGHGGGNWHGGGGGGWHGGAAAGWHGGYHGGYGGWHGGYRGGYYGGWHGGYAGWNGGYWHHGWYGPRYGWWWVVGPSWYFYDYPVYPYPDYYYAPTPTVIQAGTGPAPAQVWYYCPSANGYYPYVNYCPGGWTTVPATPQPD